MDQQHYNGAILHVLINPSCRLSVSKRVSMLGKTLSHYQILEKIGGGDMGVVYRARDAHLQRDVAIKVLPAGALGDELARNRFRKEAL
jgi:serine/threonine protein kinase